MPTLHFYCLPEKNKKIFVTTDPEIFPLIGQKLNVRIAKLMLRIVFFNFLDFLNVSDHGYNRLCTSVIMATTDYAPQSSWLQQYTHLSDAPQRSLLQQYIHLSDHGYNNTCTSVIMVRTVYAPVILVIIVHAPQWSWLQQYVRLNNHGYSSTCDSRIIVTTVYAPQWSWLQLYMHFSDHRYNSRYTS